jgi:Tetratricopeptide repeat
VINNLALSYALDGKAKESEALLRKALASGQDDKRIRQNLALVLGLQGKFGEARQVASVDMTEAQAKSSVSYLQNMLSSPTQVAAAEAPAPHKAVASAEDWSPFGYDDSDDETAPVKAPATPRAAAPVVTASNTVPVAETAKVQVVKPVDEIEAPVTSKTAQKVQTVAAAAASFAPSPPQVTQVMAPKPTPPRAKIIEVPQTQTAAAEAAPANTTVVHATKAAAPTSTVAKTAQAQTAAPAKVAQAELVIPITPPGAGKSDKLSGFPMQPATIAKADLR